MLRRRPNNHEVAQHRYRALVKRFFRGLERCFALIGLFLVIYLTGFDLTQIVSQSMAPTLQGDTTQDGDWVLTDKVTYRFRHPLRWEVVAFHNEIGIKVMKRVVGLPGEKVAIRGGDLFIDGKLMERPPELKAIDYLDYGLVSDGEEIACEEGYFVLGDRSADSEDSRFVGPIERFRIEGRAWAILWPFNRFSSLS